DRWLPMEGPDRVVEEKRRCGPHADQGGGPGEATPPTRQCELPRRAIDRIMDRYLTNGWQLLVGLGREVIPDIAGKGVGGKRAARIRLEKRYWDATLSRQV